MAIQVRRGMKSDFDPTKMLPGEWAVSIDSDTNAQIVWMCFAAGVVKRMGTYEDFKRQIKEATEDIKEEYLAEFKIILDQIEELAQQTSENTDTVVTIRDDFLNAYLPQINNYLNETHENAKSAADSSSMSLKYAQISSEKANEAHNSAQSASESLSAVSEKVLEMNRVESNVTRMRTDVSDMKSEVSAMQSKVAADKEEIDETIKSSLLASSEEILNSVKSYFEKAEAIYNSVNLTCDGGTPYTRAATINKINGGTPYTRAKGRGIKFDGGTPYDRSQM